MKQFLTWWLDPQTLHTDLALRREAHYPGAQHTHWRHLPKPRSEQSAPHCSLAGLRHTPGRGTGGFGLRGRTAEFLGL